MKTELETAHGGDVSSSSKSSSVGEGKQPESSLYLPKSESSSSKFGKPESGLLESGVDELNLAEFPLAAVSDRFLDGKKTLVFEDTVFCREQNRELPRRLTISGSDRYGLPTAKDDDVLLACIQISKLGDFATPEVSFSRYEIIKLLRWKDETKNYERVSTSLRRWKGLSIYSDRAFYDHEEKSWVNRDFGVFDNLNIYRKEVQQGGSAPGCSSFVWNEVMYRSFQAGYLKRLDWNLYTSLESAVAKRLYRFLDKRFYHSDRLEFDLWELAHHKIRLSSEYNVAQLKRALMKGITELETAWDLIPLSPEKRFLKEGKGNWKVVLERKPKRSRALNDLAKELPIELKMDGAMGLQAKPDSTYDQDQLITRLTKRGIGPGAADDLVGAHALSTIQTMIELFDWYNDKGQNRGPGFLVNAIKNPASIALPKGFQSSEERAKQNAVQKNRIALKREFLIKREREAAEKDIARSEAFNAFWQSLSPERQNTFERDALDGAEPMKRRLYLDHSGKGGKAFELYRRIILQGHFQKLEAQAPKSNPAN